MRSRPKSAKTEFVALAGENQETLEDPNDMVIEDANAGDQGSDGVKKVRIQNTQIPYRFSIGGLFVYYGWRMINTLVFFVLISVMFIAIYGPIQDVHPVAWGLWGSLQKFMLNCDARYICCRFLCRRGQEPFLHTVHQVEQENL